MTNHVSPHTVACLILSLIAPLSAQNLASTQIPSEAKRFIGTSELPGSFEVPATEKVRGEVSDSPAIFIAQDACNLDETTAPSGHRDAASSDEVLRKPSPYRQMRGQRYEVATDSLQKGLALVSAAYRETGRTEKTADCSAIALSVGERVKSAPSAVLEIVEVEVSANPACACEIVKAAISASEADTGQVVAIVEVAIHSAPESMRIISQCAIAASPESITGVQSLLSKLDPNAGESGYSSKGAKSGKDAKVASVLSPPPANPLDRLNLPPLPPPPIFPPFVTEVNPCR
ncbi:MAG: hypothetical protein Q8Q59_12915 [Luteolibacter sp.]|jgi:hypothetical protein|nr:hypothetical protein [Luteolibacter sp.]